MTSRTPYHHIPSSVSSQTHHLGLLCCCFFTTIKGLGKRSLLVSDRSTPVRPPISIRDPLCGLGLWISRQVYHVQHVLYTMRETTIVYHITSIFFTLKQVKSSCTYITNYDYHHLISSSHNIILYLSSFQLTN